MRDFKRLQEDPPEGVSGAPGENNIMIWNAVIFGPHETPFEDGTFKLMVIYYLIFNFNAFILINLSRWSFAKSTQTGHQELDSCQKCFTPTFMQMEEYVSTFSEISMRSSS